MISQYSVFFRKSLLMGSAVFALILNTSCTVNPATGEKRFDGLMPAQSESAIGAAEHEKIIKEYGGIYADQSLQSYVTSVGQKVARNTERADVQYQFFVLDSPVINAFALPGGYIYVTRGLMAVMNDEAELAAVLGHEIAHVTARHQAARYSQGFVTQLGATIAAAALGSAAASQIIGTGTNLYMSSYSREQEAEADKLGIRYLARAGYDPMAMADFLDTMENYIQVSQALKGKDAPRFNYFSSHPDTDQRVIAASREAANYPASNLRKRNEYLAMIRGMMYGDSPSQGFVRGMSFYHPEIGFTFTAPSGYQIDNQREQIIAARSGGGVVIFDMKKSRSTSDPVIFLRDEWLAGQVQSDVERVDINGLPAATALFNGALNGQPVRLRMVAINWGGRDMMRFQIALPSGISSAEVEDLKRMTYSLRRMSQEEQARIKPQRIETITAKAGDTVQTLAQQMDVDGDSVTRFRALNNLSSKAKVESGTTYKIIR
jgi:predicted Zn-dependent protease